MHLNKVDLPDPLSPIITNISPVLTSIDASLTAGIYLFNLSCSVVGLFLVSFKNFSGFSPYSFHIFEQEILI